MKTVTSKDGTSIAFYPAGAGPVVVLVAAALSDHSDASRLAELLAQHFTVINYDRRGRGASGDTPPYSVEREIEDIEALIDKAGGSAFVFGSSSGAILALDAASRLDGKITRLFLYEPPLIIDDSRPPLPSELSGEIDRLLAAGRRDEAVRLFFKKAMGIPGLFVTLMRFMPDWSKMTAIAHTIPYDIQIIAGCQAGKPIPAARWSSASAPALVMTGEKSEPFFHAGARALADLLPKAEHRILQGQNHGALVVGTQALAPAMLEFFSNQS